MTLVVVGDLVEDVVVWPNGPVQVGTDTPSQVTRSRGGSAANVAVLAAALTPTRWVGCVGADPLGDRLLHELAGAGVEVRAQRRGRTGSIVVLVDEAGERSFLTDRGAAAELGPLDPADLAGARVLHVPAYGLGGGRTADTLRALLATTDVPVSVDTSSTAVLRAVGDVRALLERVRPAVVFANADEARELGLVERPLGCDVVVKDGARPTTVLGADGSRRSVPVPPAEVRDTTGAGDAFAAGWLSAMIEGRGLGERARAGHALARQVLAHPGATRGVL